jgi:AbiV family abortive infection protein
MRRYGRALSLATLGIEEIAKAHGFGFLSIDKIIPGIIKEKTDIEPQEILNNLLKNHLYKQMLSWGFNYLTPRDYEELEIAYDKIYSEEDEEGRKKIIQKEERKYRNRMKKKVKFSKRWQSDITIFENLEKRKQDGFYVNISGSGEVKTPRITKAKNAKKVVNKLAEYIENAMGIPIYYRINEQNAEG